MRSPRLLQRGARSREAAQAQSSQSVLRRRSGQRITAAACRRTLLASAMSCPRQRFCPVCPLGVRVGIGQRSDRKVLRMRLLPQECRLWRPTGSSCAAKFTATSATVILQFLTEFADMENSTKRVNKCAPGKGGVPSLLHAGRVRPSLREHKRSPKRL